MTCEEILNMPAGREMDVLIAENVISWRVDDMTAYSPSGSANSRIHKGGDDWLPYYSADIAAAWEVVEKFYSMRLEKYSNGAEWRCYLVTEKHGKNADGNGVADTAPLAICRAALLVVMEGL